MVKLSPAQIAGIIKYEAHSGPGTSFAQGMAFAGNRDIEKDGPIFIAIAMAESRGETTATNKNTNGSTDYGLWQINSVHKELLASNQPWANPTNNFHMALQLYNGRGGKFTDWTTFNAGLYAPFLPAAQAGWNNSDDTATSPNAVHDATNSAASGIVSTAEFLSTLTNSQTWVRIGMGAAGVIILIVVIAGMMKSKIPLPGPLGIAVKAMRASKAAAPVVEGVAA